MGPRRTITVFKCPCQSFIVSEEGLEGHLYNCRKLQNEVARVNQDGKSSSENGGLTMINFHCPEVRLQRLSYSEIYTIKLEGQIKSESNCDESNQLKTSKADPALQMNVDLSSTAPPPRRSRLLAVQKLRRISGYLLNEKVDASLLNTTDDVDDDDYKPELTEDTKDFKPKTSGSNFRTRRSKSKLRNNSKHRASNKQYILKCDQCTAIFPSKGLFDLHMFKVHGEGNKKHEILTCPVCQRMIGRRLPFQKHLKLHVDAEGLEDAFDLWNKWPDKRKSAEIGLRLYCKYCLIQQTSHSTFISHMKQEHPGKGRFCKYLCQFCNVPEFDSMSKFVAHFKTAHPKEFYGKNTVKWTGAEKPESWNASEKPKARCDICNKLFDVFYLRTHKERKHPAKNGRTTIDMEESGDLFSCLVPECHAKFKFRERLKQHFILHMVNNPYKCKFPGCNVSCDAQCHLDRHMKLHTDQRQRIACDKCGVTYARKDKLKNHKCIFDPSKLKYDPNGYLCSITSHSRLTRVQAKGDFTCEPVIKMENGTDRRRKININEVIRADPVFIQVCKNNPSFKELILFSNRDNRGPRKRQTRTHTCVKCFTRFYERKALEKHKLECESNLKNDTSENEKSEMENLQQSSCSSEISDNVGKIGCPICVKSFENSTALEGHLEEAHDPEEIFRCTKCQIIYTSLEVLRRHNKLHHIHRPFKCDVSQCIQSFGTEKGLQLHKENHVTTVECTKCKKVLSCPESLVRHWWLIHGVKARSFLRSPRKKPLKRIKSRVSKKKVTDYKNRNVSLSNKFSYNTRNETKSKYLQLDSAVKIETETEMIIDDSIVKMETETEMIIDDSIAETNFEYEVPDYVKQEPTL